MSTRRSCENCQYTVYHQDSSLCINCLMDEIKRGGQSVMKLVEEPLPLGAQLYAIDHPDVIVRLTLTSSANTHPNILMFLAIVDESPDVRTNAVRRCDMRGVKHAALMDTDVGVLKAVKDRFAADNMEAWVKTAEQSAMQRCNAKI